MTYLETLILKYQLYRFSKSLKLKALKAIMQMPSNSLFDEVTRLLALKELFAEDDFYDPVRWKLEYLSTATRNMEELGEYLYHLFRVLEGYADSDGVKREQRFEEFKPSYSRQLIAHWLVNAQSESYTLKDVLSTLSLELENIQAMEQELADRPDLKTIIAKDYALLEQDLIYLGNLYAEQASTSLS